LTIIKCIKSDKNATNLATRKRRNVIKKVPEIFRVENGFDLVIVVTQKSTCSKTKL